MDLNFKLDGNDVKISKDLEAFNAIYSNILEESWEKYLEFLNQIQGISDPDELLEAVTGATSNSIDYFVKKALRYLKKYNVEMSENEFYNEFEESYFSTSSLLHAFGSQYLQIKQDEYSRQIYREYKRDTRRVGNWFGIGFGISGAIKAAIQASLLNAGTRAAYSIGDSIIDSVDRGKTRSDTKRLSNSNFFEDYAMALRKRWLGVGEAAFAKLVKEGLFNKISLQPLEVASTIKELKSISDIDVSDKIIVYISCISQYPYNFDLYTGLFDLLGFANLEVAKIAVYFGLRGELELYYAEIANPHFTKLLEMPENTPTECEKKLNALTQSMKDFGIVRDDLTYNFAAADYFHINEAHNLIMKEVRRLKKEAFVYNDKTFATAKEKEVFLHELAEENRRQNEALRAKLRAEEQKRKRIIIVLIIAAVIAGIIFIPKLFNKKSESQNTSHSASNMTAISSDIQPLYPDEPEYFESTYVPNYHRWLGGRLLKTNSDVSSSGKPYISYKYYYDDIKHVDEYGDILIQYGFHLRVDEEKEDAEHKWIYRCFTKHDPEADTNQNKSLQVHLFIYKDLGGLTIMIDHAG